MSDDPEQIVAHIFLDRTAWPDFKRLEARVGSMLKLGPGSHAPPSFVIPCGEVVESLLMGGIVDAPLPRQHWLAWVERAWWWPEAEQAMTRNQAHIIVSGSWAGRSRLDAHVAHTIVVRELVEQLPAIGVAWASVLVSAEQFAGEFHRMQTQLAIPVRLWILIQVSAKGGDRTTISTLGLDRFGLMEIEATDQPIPSELALGYIEGVCSYLISNGPVIADGHTINGPRGEGVRVRHSASFRDRPGLVYKLVVETAAPVPN